LTQALTDESAHSRLRASGIACTGLVVDDDQLIWDLDTISKGS
jgi:hypothetical protein